MKVFVVFSAICALAFGGVLPSLDDRIIGGKATTIEEHPYQVTLRYRERHNCGGSILNEDTILTAAHCVTRHDTTTLSVRVGATVHSEGEEYSLSEIIPHEDYNEGARFNNDMAILKLARPLVFNSRVQPIPLQPADTPVEVGAEAVVTGWGTTIQGLPITPKELREASVNVVSNEQCALNYLGEGTITEQMLCAQAPQRDACQGDSGGPLVSQGRLIGVVSWGFDCADPQFPGVYANVSALHEFASRYM